MDNTHCPCGSEKPYSTCCSRFIDAGELPETPEELMRSRYTAYTKANIDYIQQTMLVDSPEAFNAEEARTWAKSVNWQKLEIRHTSTQGNQGFVEFVAHFIADNKPSSFHELSQFKKENGKWIYTGGVTPTVDTFVNEQKIGRNEQCLCGSGKKYKKCCLLKNA